jgi:hypothetical protein
MASSKPGKEVSPVVAAVTIVAALLVIGGLGWYFGFRPTNDEVGKKPSQAPSLPAHIKPPSGGPVAKPLDR